MCVFAIDSIMMVVYVVALVRSIRSKDLGSSIGCLAITLVLSTKSQLLTYATVDVSRIPHVLPVERPASCVPPRSGCVGHIPALQILPDGFRMAPLSSVPS